MNKTSIEWCRTYAEDGSFTEGYSVNPVRFRPHGSERLVTMCQKVSPGCAHCYAETITKRFWPKDACDLVQIGTGEPTLAAEAKFPGYTAAGVNGKYGEHILDEKTLLSVLKCRKPTKVFWGDMTDIFGGWVRDEWLDRIFAVCALTPQLTHIFLTKRPERMLAYVSSQSGMRNRTRSVVAQMVAVSGDDDIMGCEWPLPNVWLGVSVEDQEQADKRIPLLLQTPAVVRFISAEPLLGPVDLERIECSDGEIDRSEPNYPTISGFCINALNGTAYDDENGELSTEPDGEVPLTGGLDWVICGGESGPGARPMHPDWARSLRDQGAAAGVAFFFKQWGEWRPEQLGDEARPLGSFLDGTLHGNVVRKVGKKAAGRLLDGREWNEFPEVAHA